MMFERAKITGLSGETEMTLTEQPTKEEQPFPLLVVKATKRGVTLTGNSTCIGSRQDLEELAGAIGMAWEEHKKLLGAQIQIVQEVPR